jgi:hypothetical protein
MAQGVEAPEARVDDNETIDDPMQRQVLRDQLNRVAEEKRRALEDPGPSWREWWYDSASKWWIGLGFLIVDSWVIVACFQASLPLVALPATVAAIYLEFLLWQFLWRVPSHDGPRRRGPFRPRFYALTEYGRWTPEGAAARSNPAAVVDEGPRPEEFL